MAAVGAVVVIGSINADITVYAQRLPGPGETVVGGRATRGGGGQGANQAVAGARGGADVSLVAAVGDDDLGAAALAELRAAGVDTGAVAVVAGEPTGLATQGEALGAEPSPLRGSGSSSPCM